MKISVNFFPYPLSLVSKPQCQSVPSPEITCYQFGGPPFTIFPWINHVLYTSLSLFVNSLEI